MSVITENWLTAAGSLWQCSRRLKELCKWLSGQLNCAIEKGQLRAFVKAGLNLSNQALTEVIREAESATVDGALTPSLF